MGGQSLAANGTVATLDQQWLEPNTAGEDLSRWRRRPLVHGDREARRDRLLARRDAIQQRLRRRQHVSVNAHGWPVPFSGGGTTVRAITMMLADGTLVTCSRTENADLFRHAMGGYGLFGVITDLELDMVPNALLAPTFEEVSRHATSARCSRSGSPPIRPFRWPTAAWTWRSIDSSSAALLITYRPVARSEPDPARVRLRIRQPRVALPVPQPGGVRSRQALPLVDRGRNGTDGRRQRDAQYADERAGDHARRSRSRRAPTSCTSTSSRRRASPSSSRPART